MPPKPVVAARKIPRQRRARQTVDAIIGAAAHILAERGYEGLTTNKVAERAGVSVGSLYQYFPSKESILVALFERYLEDGYETTRAAIAARPDATLEQAIELAVTALLTARGKNPVLHRRLMEEGPRLGRLARVRRIKSRSADLVQGLLEKHRREIGAVDLEAAAYVTMHLIESLTHALVLERPKLSREHATREIVAAALGYLRQPRAKGRHGSGAAP